MTGNSVAVSAVLCVTDSKVTVSVVLLVTVTGLPRADFGPSEKISLDLPNKGGPAKNPYIKSERLTLSCRVTWAGSESINLCNL
jgi:hypothetical protein